VRLALWTPRPGQAWWAGVVGALRGPSVLRVVEGEPASAPPADLHVYDVADDPAHGFVYRALRRAPGLVVLESWNLHRLVLAETLGGGDAAAYRREARRMHGETGSYVAEQVIAGRGGALPGLLPCCDRVLEASLALATTSGVVHARARRRLGGRPVLALPGDDPDRAARGILDLARFVLAEGERLRREAESDRVPEGGLLALALDEVRPAAHALLLPSVPSEVRALIADLLPEDRR
jgi:hypothetical protein